MLIGWPGLAALANRTLPITLGVDTVDVAMLELLTASDKESGADSPGIDTYIPITQIISQNNV